MSTNGKGASRPRKEAFFVQVKNADDKPIFFDATEHLGKQMPYSKPLATCALRVNDGLVAFSLLKLTQRSRTNLIESRLEIPRGPLAKLERRVAALTEPLPADGLLVEMDGVTHAFTIARDENGVARLERAGEGEDLQFELPKAAVQMTLLLVSPRNGATVAVGFIGHLNKPGTPETLARAASYALNFLTTLPTFRMVSGIETVTLPAAPSRYVAPRPARKPSEEIVFPVPVRLWSDDAAPQQIAQGYVHVKIDLDTANPVNGRLLFHFAPDQALAEQFDAYRGTMESGVSAAMSAHLGPDEVSDLVFDIALGELGEGGLGRLREAAATVTGLDLSPRQFSPFAG